MSKQLTRTAGLAVAVTAGLALTACSGASSMSTTAGATADTSGKAPTGVTLTVWHNSADTKAVLDLYKAYEKESGNKIELVDIPSATFPQTTQAKWATGARPDVLEWHGNSQDLLSLNATKNMIDLSKMDFVTKLGDLSGLTGALDGKTYGVTLGPLDAFGIFYNKKVFAANGLTVPKTYSDLASICTTLKGKGISTLFEAAGSGYPQAFLATLNYMGQYNTDNTWSEAVANGAKKVNAKGSEFVAGLTAYKELLDSGCFNSDATTATTDAGQKALLDGKAAMMSLDAGAIPIFNTDAGGDTAKVDSTIGFAPVSATTSVANWAPSPVGTFYAPITGDSTKQRAAVDFIQYISTKGYQQYVNDAGSIPTLQGYTTPKLQGLMTDVETALKSSTLSVNSAIPGFGNLGTEVSKLLAGQETPQQVADAMQTYVDQARAATKN